MLLVAKDSNVPFTNNRAERDLRMSKVKQKASGCFRKAEFAQAYPRISSYLQTMSNQGYNPLVSSLSKWPYPISSTPKPGEQLSLLYVTKLGAGCVAPPRHSDAWDRVIRNSRVHRDEDEGLRDWRFLAGDSGRRICDAGRPLRGKLKITLELRPPSLYGVCAVRGSLSASARIIREPGKRRQFGIARTRLSRQNDLRDETIFAMISPCDIPMVDTVTVAVAELFRAAGDTREPAFEDEAAVEEALFNWPDGLSGFSDRLIAAHNRQLGCRSTATFDARAARLRGASKT